MTMTITTMTITNTKKGFDEEEAVKRAGKVFESLDKNNDGGLAEDEFVKVILVFRLWLGGME